MMQAGDMVKIWDYPDLDNADDVTKLWGDKDWDVDGKSAHELYKHLDIIAQGFVQDEVRGFAQKIRFMQGGSIVAIIVILFYLSLSFAFGMIEPRLVIGVYFESGAIDEFSSRATSGERRSAGDLAAPSAMMLAAPVLVMFLVLFFYYLPQQIFAVLEARRIKALMKERAGWRHVEVVKGRYVRRIPVDRNGRAIHNGKTGKGRVLGILYFGLFLGAFVVAVSVVTVDVAIQAPLAALFVAMSGVMGVLIRSAYRKSRVQDSGRRRVRR